MLVVVQTGALLSDAASTFQTVEGEERTLQAALADTMLGGRGVRRLAIPNGEVALAVDIEGSETLEAWRAGRQVVDQTGRWPVAVAAWDYGRAVDESVFAGWYLPPGTPPPDPRELAARARSLSHDDALAFFPGNDAYWDEDWEPQVRWQLDQTRYHFGEAPPLEEVFALDLRPRMGELEAWLMEWEEARRPTTQPVDGGHLGWFDPSPDHCALIFLPTNVSDDAVTYVPFYGAETPDTAAALAAVLRSWRERYGAELVASWGTMLQFVVARPPNTLSDAFALALEQEHVALPTLGLAGVTVRNHARALLERSTWFLHDRP